MNRKEKRLLKKLFKTRPAKQKISLMEEPRIGSGKSGDSCDEYGFVLGCENSTDEEIDEWMNENVRRHYHPSQWDCTGQIFTSSLHWHRNPCGAVSFVNHLVMDV